MRIDDIALALLVGEGNPEKNSLNFLPIQEQWELRIEIKLIKRKERNLTFPVNLLYGSYVYFLCQISAKNITVKADMNLVMFLQACILLFIKHGQTLEKVVHVSIYLLFSLPT